MANIITYLEGKKTFLVCAGSIIYAGLGLALGFLDQDTAIQTILAALGLSALRAKK